MSPDLTVEVGAPRLLFGGKPLPFNTALDITSDGKRILMAVPTGESGSHSLTLVTNWTAALGKK